MKTLWLSLVVATALLVPAAFAADDDDELSIPWSFARLARPAVPDLADNPWPKDPLDHFIAERLAAEGLRPTSDADRRTLIRRAAFDLTGLPPSPEHVSAFLNDPAGDDQAFAKVIDAYLASPRFGERWARHWLDIVRYADSVGRTWNAPFPYAWRYRDWVIDSLNADKSYDRFIAEQLAGDLLTAPSVEQRRQQVVATGFLTLGSLALNDGNQEAFLMDQIDDQIDVTSRAFLGLTIACARCHDHKYDPISQEDYYALAGIFYSSWTYPGQAHVRDQAGHGYVDPEMLVLLPNDLDSAIDRVRDVPAGVHSMNDVNRDGGAKAPPPYDLHPDFAMGMRDGKPADCELRIGGDAYQLGEAPPRGNLKIPGLPALPQIADTDSGRLQLAQWIASPTHPLTSRVMVNRLWQHLFGAGLVETVDDFGITGREPVHPQLLDHLAVRFVEQDWSIKQMIRTLMLSHTYRLSNQADVAAMEKDPDNTLFWRMRPRRLEFEPLRDSLLELSGRLRSDRPDGIQVAGNGGKGRVGQTRSWLSLESPYRSIYLPVLRDLLPEEYGTFDFPDPTSINGLRHVTTAPPQALFFMNSRFVEDAAGDTAARLIDAEPIADKRLLLTYRTLFAREPDATEIDAAKDLLRALDSDAADHSDRERERWGFLIQGLMASAEFRYVF